MKKPILQYSINAAQASIFLAVGILMFGCNNSNNDSTSMTGLSMKVIDAKGSPVEGASVTVLTGGDPDNVIADTDEKQKTGASGVAKFESSKASKAINLKAFKKGYFSNTITATTAKDSDVTEIVITKKESLGDAIRFKSNTGSGAVGFITEVVGEANDKPVKTKIVIPANLLNDKGDAIGEVTLEVAHYNSQDTTSLSSFPGGFSAQIENPSDINGTSISGASSSSNAVNFVSAGFVAVELTDKTTGEKITKFDSSTPLTITMALDSQATFPLAGGESRAIVAGDIIPVWSYDEDTGKWGYENEGTVSDQDGKLVVTYDVTHLSYYNLDWWGAEMCDATLNLSYAYPNNLKGMVYKVGGGWSHNFNYDAGDPTSITLFNAPQDINVTMTLEDLTTGKIVYTKPEFNLCNDSPIAIPLPVVTGGSGSGS